MKNLLDCVGRTGKNLQKEEQDDDVDDKQTNERKKNGAKRKRFMYAMCNEFCFLFCFLFYFHGLYTTAFSPFLILINFEGLKNSFRIYVFSFLKSQPFIYIYHADDPIYATNGNANDKKKLLSEREEAKKRHNNLIDVSKI